MIIQPSTNDHRKEFFFRFKVLSVAALAALTFISPNSPAIAAEDSGTDTPTVTYNDFIPEERDLSDCISAIPKPGCGSEAKGGWRQMLVLGLVVTGLGFIGWRVIAGARKNLATATPQSGDE